MSALLACFMSPVASAQSALSESSIALEAGELATATAILDRLPEAEQNSAPVLFQRGMIRFHGGDYAEAVKLIERAIAEAPRSPHLSEFRRML